MKAKLLLNVRGGSGVGKTTAVKQFCNKHGIASMQTVKALEPQAVLPITVLKDNIIVLGDYTSQGKCLGADHYGNGKIDIINAVWGVAQSYNPSIIVYEHMFTSHLYKGTSEIATVGIALGYNYCGLLLRSSLQEQLRRLEARGAKSKNAIRKYETVVRAAVLLREHGFPVIEYDTEFTPLQDMGAIIDDTIRTALA